MSGGDTAVLHHAGQAVDALHSGGGPTQGDLERVDVQPGADIEDQLLGELLAYLEGPAEQPRHHLGPLQQVFVHGLGVGLLEVEESGPGLDVRPLEVETPDNGDDVVQRVRVLRRDVEGGPSQELTLGEVARTAAALETAERPPALRTDQVRHRAAVLHLHLLLLLLLLLLLPHQGRGEVQGAVAADTAGLGLPARPSHQRPVLEDHLALPQPPGGHQVTAHLTALGHPVAYILHHTVAQSGLQVVHGVITLTLLCCSLLRRDTTDILGQADRPPGLAFSGAGLSHCAPGYLALSLS